MPIRVTEYQDRTEIAVFGDYGEEKGRGYCVDYRGPLTFEKVAIVLRSLADIIEAGERK
jgi:hypothetical protein